MQPSRFLSHPQRASDIDSLQSVTQSYQPPLNTLTNLVEQRTNSRRKQELAPRTREERNGNLR
jgi:hypothetical protein